MSAFAQKCKVIAFAVGVIAVGGSPAFAGDAPRTLEMSGGHGVSFGMPISRPAAPPRGFLDFCRRRPSECVEAGSSESAQDIAGRASSLYWASVFGGDSQAEGPAASTVRADVALTRTDWERVFSRSRNRAAFDTASAPREPVIRGAEATFPMALASLPVPPVSPVVRSSGATGEDLPDLVITLIEGLNRDSARAPQWSADPAVSDGYELSVRLAASVPDMPPVAELKALSEVAISPTVDIDSLRLSSLFQRTEPSGEQVRAHQPPAEIESFSVSLDRAGWALVNGVNRDMNRRIRQSSDIRAFGVEDFWQVPGGSDPRGDCEDYVLAKRRALIAGGIPATALSIAIVRTVWGESHAVLLLAADDGEYVLDNLTPWISRRERVNYDWQERQAPGKVFEWVRMAT